tara:strand:- start:1680 stop:2219 length:540 start_codon:yes stop_codon:yes gene_type:complete
MAVAFSLWGLIMTPSEARQDDPRLNALFDRLYAIDDGNEAHLVMKMIWRLWSESGSRTVDFLFTRGVQAMNQKRFDTSLAMFNSVVEIDPEFSEGWNARATLHYIMGNYENSIRDIDRTLALEPRHWGALSGLGMIYQDTERNEEAIQAYHRALAVNPHLPGAKNAIAYLTQKVRGREL